METAGGIFGGIVGIAILLFGIVLTLFWLILPLVIYFKLSKIEAHLSDLNKRDAARYVQQRVS